MAWEVPSRVREALGDEVVMAFVPWLDERYIAREKAMPRDEYREVLSRLDGLEKDILLIKEEQTKFRVELGQMRSDLQEGQDQLRSEFKQEQAQMRAEFREDLGELRREVHERFDRVNERFDGMSKRFDERFDGMNGRFDERFEGMNERFDKLNARFDQMHRQIAVQTRWVIGVLALMATVVSALVGIAQFTP